MKRLLVATGNPGKVREFAEALIPTGIDVYGLDALADRSEVPETGTTFEANARLKAEGYASRTDMPVLADDSGLEVDALDGDPGVLSARYGGDGLDDTGRNRRLLEALADVPEQRRGARFRCVLAVAQAGRTLVTFEGVVEGRILREPRGPHGFGYDPLFFHPETGMAFGQLPTAVKRQWSHRGRAIAAFLEALRSEDPRLAAAG